MDNQPQQIEVEWSQLQVQHLACSRRRCQRQRHLLDNIADVGPRCIAQATGQCSYSLDLAVLHSKAGDVEHTGERTGGCPAPAYRRWEGTGHRDTFEWALQRGRRETKDAEQLVEQVAEQAIVVEQTGDGTEEVAEQIAGSGLRRDIKHDLVQMDNQPQQIEVKRAEDQM